MKKYLSAMLLASLLVAAPVCCQHIEDNKEVENYICMNLGVTAGVLSDLDLSPIEVVANEVETVAEAYEQPELYLVDCTAYYDERGQGHGADGSKLVADLTVAGKIEWLGKTVVIYDENMNYICTRQFRDTGYGQSTGYGESRVLPGRSLGTIETGECIDLYMETYSECMEWGRRKVYIQIIDAEG